MKRNSLAAELTSAERWLRLAPIVLLVAGAALRLAIILAKPAVLWVDDTFYSLGIARHIALGDGATHDGVHPTNGYQPLYVWLMVPVFQLTRSAAPAVAAQIALLFLAACNLAGGYVVYRLARDAWGRYGALFIWASWTLSPYIISGVNGLETSLTFLLLALTTRHYVHRVRNRQPSRRALVILGLLLGLAILARIDSALFALALALDYGATARRRAIALWPTVAVAALLVAPWIVSNSLRFGTPIPHSGRAVRLRSLQGAADGNAARFYSDNLFAALDTLQRRTASTVIPLTPYLPYAIFWIAVIIATVGGVLLLRRQPAPPGASSWRPYAFLGGWAVLLVGTYVFYQHGVWFFGRYFYPLLLPLLLSAAYGLARLRAALVRDRRALFWIGLLLWCGWLPFSQPRARNVIWTDPEQLPVWSLYETADWLKQNTPADSVIGAYQSGILGYFSDRTVVNLDGVVNADALPHLLDGTTHRYVQTTGIDYVADWRPLLARYLDLAALPHRIVHRIEQPPVVDIIEVNR